MDKWKDDIEKYLAGKLTPAERHALEKKALSDPFLSDALEGAEEISAESFSLDVHELNQKILGEGKSRWLWPLRIAASVVGIAVISTIIIYSSQDSTENLASNTEKQKKEPATETKADSVNQPEEKSGDPTTEKVKETSKEEKKAGDNLVAVLKDETPKSTKATEEKITQSFAGAGGVSHSGKPLSTQGTTDGVVLADTIGASGLASITQPTVSIQLTEADVTDDKIAPSAPPTPQPDMIKSKESKRSAAKTSSVVNLVVNGVVKDQKGDPIPGVNIVTKGSQAGTITNAEGKYSIEVPNNDQTLVYSFIGFESQEQPVDKLKNASLDIRLEEDVAQLSEVIVTGYGKRDNNEPVVRLAEPNGGRKAYDQYLEEKKVYPPEALANKVEGRVIVEFTVGVTGLLSDFQFVRKIGYGCEEEVIRLVKEGPGWQPSFIDNDAVESLVRIKTRFKLPGK